MIPLMRRIAVGAMTAAACACLILAGSHGAVAAPVAATAPSGTKATLPSGDLGLQDLKRFADLIGWNGTGVVVISGESNLAFKPTDATQNPMWSDVVNELNSADFTVLVSMAGPTGTAGSLLYAIAKERVVVDGAIVPRLPGEVTAFCSGSLCSALAAHGISVTTSTPSADLADTVEYLPAARLAKSGNGTGSVTWLLVALILVTVALLWFAGGRQVVRRVIPRPLAGPGQLRSWQPGLQSWAVPPPASTQPDVPIQRPERTRPESAPRPERTRPVSAARPEPRHGHGEGIVRTMMSPEGYVEVDGLLYRGTWRGSRAAPRQGTVVVVGRDRDGELAVVDRTPAPGDRG